MHCPAILSAYLYGIAAALPLALNERQTSGLTSPGEFLGGNGTTSISLSTPSVLLGKSSSLAGSTSDRILKRFLDRRPNEGRSETSNLAPRVVDSSGSSTENGLDGACQEVTLIFARGTSETGNMGTIVGPGLSTDIKSALSNNVSVQGVDYPADSAGITEESSGTGGTGTKAMVSDVQTALSKCPSTQIVLAGYSQGAMLVHNTMSSLSSAQADSVKAAVTFGDPFVGQSVKNLPSDAFKSYCASGDSVCSFGTSTSPSSGGTTSASTEGHLGYGADTGTAATFIRGKVTI